MGRPALHVAHLIVNDFGLDLTALEYHQIVHREVMLRFRDCKMMPGVSDLLAKLVSLDIPMAVIKRNSLLRLRRVQRGKPLRRR